MRPYAIMAGNVYLAGHRGGFAWTSEECEAKRFNDPRDVQKFIDVHVDGDLRVVRVD